MPAPKSRFELEILLRVAFIPISPHPLSEWRASFHRSPQRDTITDNREGSMSLRDITAATLRDTIIVTTIATTATAGEPRERIRPDFGADVANHVGF